MPEVLPWPWQSPHSPAVADTSQSAPELPGHAEQEREGEKVWYSVCGSVVLCGKIHKGGLFGELVYTLYIIVTYSCFD